MAEDVFAICLDNEAELIYKEVHKDNIEDLGDEDEDVIVVEDEDELPKSLSFPENPHPDKYIKMGSK